LGNNWFRVIRTIATVCKFLGRGRETLRISVDWIVLGSKNERSNYNYLELGLC